MPKAGLIPDLQRARGCRNFLRGQCGAGGRAFSCLPSSLPSLCPQNAERLLETAGIKVGCSEVDVGSSGALRGKQCPQGPVDEL